MPENKKFWKFCNQAGNKVELLLYGDISQTSWWGDEVTPKQFAEELAGLGALDEITVRINSGGGIRKAQISPRSARRRSRPRRNGLTTILEKS